MKDPSLDSDDQAAAATTGPFGAGPYSWLTRAALFRPLGRYTWRRTVVTALITWVPLVLLAALEGNALSPNMRESVLLDLRATVRYLVAAPLFVAAGTVYLPQLAMAVRTFLDAELIARHDRARYDALVASTRRLVASPTTDLLLTALAYVVTFTASPAFASDVATWVVSADGHFSYAGWWRMLVSQPMFLALWAIWLWRLALWTRFTWTVARLDLRLVAGHPDRVGGLRFVLNPIWGFAILAFAMGAIGAGTIAESVIVDHRQLVEFQYLVAGQALFSVVIFAAPLLLLSIPLLRLQAYGTVRYGRLASRLGRQFERRWVDEGHRAVDAEALEAPDYSATVDLYGIVANIQNINPLVLELQHVVILAVATLLPYLAVIFAVLPFDRIVELAMKALT